MQFIPENKDLGIINRQIEFSVADEQMESLPVLVNFNDVRNLVRLLKKKPEGFSVVEINDIFLRRLLDSCKIMAYEKWGIIRNDNNIISLSSLGKEFAKYSDSEALIYQKILRNIKPYHQAIKWIADQNKSMIVYLEIIRFWKGNFPNLLLNKDEMMDENMVISFFNLCHFGELGIATIGRKSHLTRLQTDHQEINAYLQNSDNLSEISKLNGNGCQNGNGHLKTNNLAKDTKTFRINPAKIFLSIDEDSELLSPIKGLFEIAGVDSEMIFRFQKGSYLMMEHHQKMKSCSAAIIVANERNCLQQGKENRITERLLSEIIAVSTLFEKKVLVIWHGRTCPVFPIEDLNLICLKTQQLDWETGLRIGKIVRGFKTVN